MDFKRLSKLGRKAVPQEPPPGENLKVIVKVRADGYRPKKAHVRADLGARMFTADVSGEDLDELRKDKMVESVALSEALPLQKAP